MKKCLFMAVLLLTATILSAGTVVFEQQMPFPQLQLDKGELLISYSDCLMIGDEGEPLLPWRGIDLLLPQNEKAEGVKIIDIEYYPVEEKGYIKPASRPFAISQPAPADYAAQPLPEIYERNASFPVSALSSISTGYLCGHSIASLSFCPVKYNPVENTARFIKSVTISVETAPVERAVELQANLKTNHMINNRINSIVDNPDQLDSYSYNSRERIDDYDMLLITNEELQPYFQDYVDFKESTGFSIAVEVVEDIYANYTGIDNAAQVRSCISDYYQSYDIDYVILGGDAGNSNETAVVPHRGFAVDDDDSLPSDMYFSNLDGTWNNDGDGYWGEQNEIDPYAEVLIGRICVDSPAEVANAVNKHILYQNDPVIEDIEKAVMVGEELNDNPQTNGGDYKDQIADGGTYDGYYTEGISPNFNINYFYERDIFWNKYDLYDEFSDTGINLLNHLGHSSPTYNMKMENSDLTESNFTNNGITRGFAIGYSQGCYNGSFDNYHYNGYYTEDCFAEKFSGGISSGEVACIANSRYGWYSPGGTNSSSQYYDRMFFHGIFGEGLSQVGNVNRYSHEDNVSMMQNSSNMRWVCYETNLFGDPSLDIWTAEPDDMVLTYPATLPIGISSVQISSDTPYTRIGLVQDGELIGRGVTDEYGQVNITTFEEIDSPGLITVSGIAHNKNRFLGNIVIVTDQPYVVMQAITVDDVAGNNNGLLDYGEAINLDLSLNNVGSETAVGVSASISTFDSYFVVTNGSVDVGDINGETIIELTGAFSAEIADNVPDQHIVTFTLEVTDENNTVWNSNFSLTLNAPVITGGYAQIDDSAGNNDGVMDPGETVILTFPTINSGNAATGEVQTILLSFDSWITIPNASVDLEPLAPGEQAEAEFTVIIAEDTPEGQQITFNYNASSGAYSTTEDYSYTVGLVLEDFESGDFEAYPWTFNGSEWTIDDYAYSGDFSARSAQISDNTTTSLLIETWVRADGEISFYKKVSCEADPDNHNFDWMGFYIDGQQIERWDGEDPWSLETYNVSEGLHTFEWRYRKDQAVSSGSDAAWIDYIVFPPMGPPPAPEMVADVAAIDLEIMPDDETSQQITLENLGVGDINYSVQILDTTPYRDLSGSSLICNSDSYTPGETTGWVFELTNNSTDGENINFMSLDFPEGITVNVSTGFYGGSDPLMPDDNTGNGAMVSWTGNEGIYPGETATAGINVTVDPEYTGEVMLNYQLIGDDSSIESGEIYLFSLGIGWCNLSHNTGTIETFGTEDITLNFSSAGLAPGDYTADLIISDERTVLQIPVTMNVINTPVTDEEIIQTNELVGAYPNPFNPETNIKFKLAQTCNIILDIYNIRGQLVSRIADGSYNSGEYSIPWNGTDKSGHPAASGIYLCRFTARPVASRPDGNDSHSAGPSDHTTVTKIALMK